MAERVIQASRCPLRPVEIIHRAHATGLLPWHLHGARQDKTLHARMSVDVARDPEASRFYRTGPGTFFLKEMIADAGIPEAFKHRYFAPPRRKELRREHILALDRGAAIPTDKMGFVGIARIRAELKNQRYSYQSYQSINSDTETAAIHSFVLVFHQEKVLSYRCGKFAPANDPLFGLRSIGLGGAVYASDNDLLFDSMQGVIGSGINELGYGIGLPKRLAERARYGREVRPQTGVILPFAEGRPSIVHVVLAYECPRDFLPSKAALSVNDLRWLDVSNPANRLDDFDYTSKRLFSSGRLISIRNALRRDGERQSD